MAIRKQKKEKGQADVVAVPQTEKSGHPFASLHGYHPAADYDIALYKSLREAVPIIDAAIMKIVRLLGTFSISCENEKVQAALRDFLSSVKVGGTRQGIDAFLSTYFEQLLTCGTALGEIVTDGREITHLFNGDLRSVRLSEGASPLEITVNADSGNGKFYPVKYPSLVLLCVHNPEPGKIYGTSILKGLPFVSDILLTIYNTIGVNWERVGNVRFAVTYKPQNDAVDKAYAKERAMQVASEWSRTMHDGSAVRDFVAVGDVSIKAIGADNQILDSDVPVREMLEQIVAKLGIPPFLLGLSWSTTERMSHQQADILTSEIDAYRREVTPTVRKICDLWLRLNGISCDYTVDWEDITLQDITELSQSRYYDAQSQQILSQIGGESHEQ
ncbi:MAG: serine/threonine protein phosphatase [Oscillospiraceae bacterium]|nr:serine/threonine protein phosphatase [Oscillospiraceae bacterium]